MSIQEMTSTEAQAIIHSGKVARGEDVGRRANDSCDACHYCGMAFGTTRHEHDHAPIPSCEGGENTVPACLTCHEVKDRAHLAGMSATDYAVAVQGLLANGLLASATLSTPPTDWPKEWPTMTRWERIVWANVVRTAHEAATVGARMGEDGLWGIMKLSPA